MTPDKLPEEITEDILLSAKAFAAGMWSGISKHDANQRIYVASVWEAGATAWAPWKVKYDDLLAKTNLSLGIQRKCTDDAQATAKRMILQRNDLKTVLQEFVSKHEAGLLPDRFVYEKAIKILNDGK